MTSLEQRLTKLAEKLGDEYSTSISGPIPIHKVGFEIGFKAGAASMIPIIVKLEETLRFYAMGWQEGTFVDDKYGNCGFCGRRSRDTLKELEDFIDKQGE